VAGGAAIDAQPRVVVMVCATCGVTFSSRHSMTKFAVS
jgi:hypothetical protein